MGELARRLANIQIRDLVHFFWVVGAIFVFAITTVFLVLVSESVQLQKHNAAVNSLELEFTRLSTLTDGLVVHGSSDTRTGWQRIRLGLEKRVDAIANHGVSKASVDGLRRNLADTDTAMTDLVMARKKGGDPGQPAAALLETMQAVSASVDLLGRRVMEERQLNERRLQLLVALMIVTLSIGIVWVGVFTKTRVLQPLSELETGLKLLGSDLTRRLKVTGDDEMAQFSLAVNRMAADLEQTHASRAELEEEMARRKALEEKERTFFDQDLSLHMMVGTRGQILRANSAARKLLFDSNEIQGSRCVFNYIDIEDAAALKSGLASLHPNAPSTRFETRIRTASGESRVLSCAVNLSIDEGTYFVAAQDITDRKASEAKLRLSASVFTSALEGIMITDRTGTIIDANQALQDITGFDRDEIIGQNPKMFQSGRQDALFYKEMWETIHAQGAWRGEIWNRRKNGEIFPEVLTISSVTDEAGDVSHFIGMCSDITRLKQNEMELEHLAHFDALTGLPNRVLLSDRIRTKMLACRRQHTIVALAFIDLDGFKEINDTYGHQTGDLLLIAAADRMSKCLRETDTLARMGGDEFVAVLGELQDVDMAEHVFDRLLSALAEPFVVQGHALRVTGSIGISFFTEDNQVDEGLLLRQADMAMYQAKVHGKNRCYHYDPSEVSELQKTTALITEVEAALADDHFELFYQPKVDLRSGEIIDVEALLRWCRPDGEIVGPAGFLPGIEDHDIIIDVGNYVMKKALEQIGTWSEQGIDYGISVNIAGRHLQSPNFSPQFESLVANIDTSVIKRLEIEVLETTAINCPNTVIEQMDAIMRQGVKFSLDDFGTGYSSLTYLRDLPISKIKIDQGFIRGILLNQQDQKILRGIVSLGESFGLDVVAEGVETLDHGKWLLNNGCHLAQGYAICKPKPIHDFMVWRTHWLKSNPWQRELEEISGQSKKAAKA